MIPTGHPQDNRLLAALGEADWQRWEPRLERVELSLGQVLYEPGRIPRYAYFPSGAIAAIVCGAGRRASTEVAIVGSEGMIGTSLFLGRTSTTGHGTVLFAGPGYRLGAQVIRDEFDRSGSVRRLLLRYTQALATQIAQTAVCNRLHSILQQVCSWLLYCLDRLQGSDVAITQTVIASLLGVRRESVTEAALQLQAAGVIRYARGHITVFDRAGLERLSCGCHAVVRKETERLLPIGRVPVVGGFEEPDPIAPTPAAGEIGPPAGPGQAP